MREVLTQKVYEKQIPASSENDKQYISKRQLQKFYVSIDHNAWEHHFLEKSWLALHCIALFTWSEKKYLKNIKIENIKGKKVLSIFQKKMVESPLHRSLGQKKISKE